MLYRKDYSNYLFLSFSSKVYIFFFDKFVAHFALHENIKLWNIRWECTTPDVFGVFFRNFPLVRELYAVPPPQSSYQNSNICATDYL